MRTENKGRSFKQEVLNRLVGYNDYDTIRDNLKLNGSPDILLACAWMSDGEYRMVQMFPDVFFCRCN